jgi:hypothetical protein
VDRSRIATFLVPAAKGAIQRLLDATLNAASTGAAPSGWLGWLKNLFGAKPKSGAARQRFKPLLGLDVMALTFIHYPSVRATTTPWGSFSYDECAVFLLLKDENEFGPGMCWHVPFILLDACLPMLMGREIYGFPKVIGDVDCSPLLAADWQQNPRGTFTVAAEGFPRHGANVHAQQVPVAEVKASGFPPGSLVNTIDHAGDDLLAFAQRITGGDHLDPLLVPFVQALVSAGLPGVFLKELPGADANAPAAHRQLVKAAFTPTGTGGMSFVRGEVKLHDPASYPLASTFGIAAGQALNVPGIFIDLSWNLPPPTHA